MVTRFDDNAGAISWLRTPQAIRSRCAEIGALVERGDSRHFALAPEALPAAARYVAETIRETYPDLAIPHHSRWRHFTVGGIDRWAALARQGGDVSPRETARRRIDLAVTSVLLDAGAGAGWRYREPGRDAVFARSEGLALASFHMFADGGFSADPDRRLRADAAALRDIDVAALAAAFQVDDANPLAGLEGRAGLMRRLGAALEAAPDLFGAEEARVGRIFDYLADRATDGALPAADMLEALLRALEPVWPPRLALGDTNLGDVWRHPGVKTDDMTDGLVPFHKLAQWLAYSLVEPLEEAGIAVTGLDSLTGLAEYRNGGLFVDLGVVVPRDLALTREPQAPDSEAVIEWRALTVMLLDRIAAPVRRELGAEAAALSLSRLLEGGTWRAGRRIAAKLRPGGPPPIQVVSDGTVM